jgi:hypothetical protein
MKLSSIMRYILTETNNSLVPLQNEVDFTKNYIELQQVRLTEKTTVNFDVVGEVDNRNIAPLLFIPFVENAFKYGISTKSTSEINIHIESLDNKIIFTYSNSIVKSENNMMENTGIGINNVKRRLELMYSDIRILTEIIWPKDVGSYIVSKNKILRDLLSKTSQQKVAVKVDYGVCGSKPSFTISWPSNYDINKRNYKSKIIKVIQNEFPNSGPITTSNNYWDTFKSYSTEDRRYWSKEQQFNFFVEQSKNSFGDSYEYDINKFNDLDNLAEVFCKQHQRWFEVFPKEHINGKRCPFDNESKGETMVRVYLEKNNIPFKQFHKLKGCFSEINGRCILLTFDFYLPEQNAVIEYDGEQHYKPVERFGGEPTYQRQVILDNIKNVFCSKSGIKMIRIPYTVKKPKDIKELLDTQLK